MNTQRKRQCTVGDMRLTLTPSKVVQAPNSLLNTLFILNQRRSSGLADPIQLVLRFGTPASAVEELKARMLDFVLEHKRDYQPRIISEVRTIDEVYSVTLNVIFFHKSNYQNELLRLQRHNKFAAELMHQMTLLGIEGPRKAQPGGAKDYPFYYAPVNLPPNKEGQQQPGAAGPFPPTGVSASVPSPRMGSVAQESLREVSSQSSMNWNVPPSPETHRKRAESRAREIGSRLPDFGDVYEGRKDPAAANLARLQSLREEASSSQASSVDRLAPLDRAGTMDSNSTRRRGIFGGRPRSATKTTDGRSDAGGSIV